MSLSIDLSSSNNNFTLIRMVAALGVFLSHSFYLSGYASGGKPALLGFVSLNVFFFISGLLVTKSFFDRGSLFYFKSRLLRVFPALIGAVVFSVFTIGLIFTTLDKSDYLLSFDTYIYFFKNILLLLPHTPQTLPGVFTQTNVTAVVNAPLWSLPYELICYLSLPVLGFLTQAKNKKMIFTLIVILLFIFMYGIFIYNFSYRLEIFSSFISKDGYRLFSIFLMGSITYLFSQYIVLSWKILLASFVLIIFYILFDFRILLVGTSFLVMGYGILFIAYLPVGIVRNYNKLGDYSYGIYIFGYPIQQAVEHLYPSFSLLTYTFISLSLTLVFAIFSWHWIERYFLSFK